MGRISISSHRRNKKPYDKPPANQALIYRFFSTPPTSSPSSPDSSGSLDTCLFNENVPAEQPEKKQAPTQTILDTLIDEATKTGKKIKLADLLEKNHYNTRLAGLTLDETRIAHLDLSGTHLQGATLILGGCDIEMPTHPLENKPIIDSTLYNRLIESPELRNAFPTILAHPSRSAFVEKGQELFFSVKALLSALGYRHAFGPSVIHSYRYTDYQAINCCNTQLMGSIASCDFGVYEKTPRTDLVRGLNIKNTTGFDTAFGLRMAMQKDAVITSEEQRLTFLERGWTSVQRGNRKPEDTSPNTMQPYVKPKASRHASNLSDAFDKENSLELENEEKTMCSPA